jgi:acyl carrier protein
MAEINREHIEHWIVQSLSGCAGLDPQDIDVALPCTAYGLDSLTGVTLVGDLELWLNLRLSPTLLWDMPSIDHLVQHLADALPVAPDDVARESKFDQAWIAGLKIDPETARQLLPQLEQLSDQDVEAILYKLAA